jgi:hypothetical protein
MEVINGDGFRRSVCPDAGCMAVRRSVNSSPFSAVIIKWQYVRISVHTAINVTMPLHACMHASILHPAHQRKSTLFIAAERDKAVPRMRSRGEGPWTFNPPPTRLATRTVAPWTDNYHKYSKTFPKTAFIQSCFAENSELWVSSAFCCR